jgi:2-hydroxy-3-keto-5-methylthiopentenyl-1-phosphate phosphatase
MKPTVAFLYDFDKTLSTRDMQEFTFIPSLGLEAHEFWSIANSMAKREKMDSILAYMYVMLQTANSKGLPLTRDMLMQCGKDIEYYNGVREWFDHINRVGEEAGVHVEHYILSSGLREIILGSTIAPHFTEVFASEFLYEDGKAVWPKTAVNYTAKTQFVYRINKGVLDISNDTDLNKSTPEDSKLVKFSNMIYIGDGLTDVPCMKLVKLSGGHSIALYQRGKAATVEDLLKHERVDFIFEADYTVGGALEQAVSAILRKLAVDNSLKSLSDKQRKQCEE